jgi:glucan phosphoethanolaminetransferase (alkaline phosphatase superfamily)
MPAFTRLVATAVATATAVSVPCMFSHLPREKFDVAESDRYTNLLDVLRQVEFFGHNLRQCGEDDRKLT